jgi:CheY-like chemotaxis protein
MLGLVNTDAPSRSGLTPERSEPARPLPHQDRVPTPEATGPWAEPARDFLSGAPEYLATTCRMFNEISQLTDSKERQQGVRDVYRRVQGLAATTRTVGLPVTAHLSSMLTTLLKKLCDNANTITPSTLNTVSRALAFLERWCVPGMEEKGAGFAPVQLLVVEDEPLARRAVMGTLELAFDKPETASNGAAALELVAQQAYDVIFTDVQMPFMNGFELCQLIRMGGANQATPVVFISACTDAASHAEGYRSGGSDFIAKPFLPSEMAVKALTFAWEGRLRRIEAGEV